MLPVHGLGSIRSWPVTVQNVNEKQNPVNSKLCYCYKILETENVYKNSTPKKGKCHQRKHVQSKVNHFTTAVILILYSVDK